MSQFPPTRSVVDIFTLDQLVNPKPERVREFRKKRKEGRKNTKTKKKKVGSLNKITITKHDFT